MRISKFPDYESLRKVYNFYTMSFIIGIFAKKIKKNTMSEKTKIPAVFKEDLKKLLLSISELEPIEKGERLCCVCSKNITLDNIQLLVPRKDKIFEFVCDSPTCVEEYNRKKGE